MTSRIRTTQGHAWDQIAKTAYGSELRMDAVLSGNLKDADVLLFSGDTPLTLPEAPAEARRAGVNPPPWERI